jgi:hypothetical protein
LNYTHQNFHQTLLAETITSTARLSIENIVLSPADGKVIYVSKVQEGSSLVSTK